MSAVRPPEGARPLLQEGVREAAPAASLGEIAVNAGASVAPLDALERRLVDGFQRGFPICARPWARVAAQLGASEAEVIAAVARRLADGVVSRVGAVFRPNVIGASTLAAIAVPEGRLAEVARIVSARDEVNHNYQREHAFNLWFVAAAADAAQLDAALAAIEHESGLRVIRLPLVRDYWIDLGFDVHATGMHVPPVRRVAAPVAPVALSEQDRRIVAALEDGLPAEPRPYAEVARRAGVSEAYLTVRLADWLNRGVVSRFGLVVRHRPLGYAANAMCVWDVPDDRADALGAALAREDAVTLAYRRRRADGWRYNLYAMIHGRDRAAVSARRDAIAAALGLDGCPHDVLFSLAAYKQRGARYASRAVRAGAPPAREPQRAVPA